jgi:threonine dehydratase
MINLQQIHEAAERLAGIVTRTPLVRCTGTPFAQAYVKPESLQPVGAFKLRGAFNKIATLSDEQRSRGVIAFSSGNHAQGVAYAARALGVNAVIVMPARAPDIKKQKTVAMGADIVIAEEGGEVQWREVAESIATERGLTMVPPYDDESIVAGQATVGLEIVDDMPDVETVLVPVGGGGLISGAAAALKLLRPDVHVVGVEPELANDAQLSFRSGKIVELPIEQTCRTIADGMRATRIGNLSFQYIQAFVDDMITVSEAEIRRALRTLLLDARVVAEPSGAVPFAALQSRSDQLPAANRVVAVISGGNVDAGLLGRILAEES